MNIMTNRPIVGLKMYEQMQMFIGFCYQEFLKAAFMAMHQPFQDHWKLAAQNC